MGWIIHNPVSVTTRKGSACFLAFPADVKVNVLLAKKLNINAAVVDIKLATYLFTPTELRKKSNTKSRAVFITPTRPNRILLSCLFTRSFMILFYKIKWPLLTLVEYPTDILTYNT